MVKEAKISVEDAVYMLTQVPAGILKLNKGSIKKGKDADITVFDKNINIKAVFVNGEKMA